MEEEAQDLPQVNTDSERGSPEVTEAEESNSETDSDFE